MPHTIIHFAAPLYSSTAGHRAIHDRILSALRVAGATLPLPYTLSVRTYFSDEMLNVVEPMIQRQLTTSPLDTRHVLLVDFPATTVLPWIRRLRESVVTCEPLLVVYLTMLHQFADDITYDEGSQGSRSFRDEATSLIDLWIELEPGASATAGRPGVPTLLTPGPLIVPPDLDFEPIPGSKFVLLTGSPIDREFMTAEAQLHGYSVAPHDEGRFWMARADNLLTAGGYSTCWEVACLGKQRLVGWKNLYLDRLVEDCRQRVKFIHGMDIGSLAYVHHAAKSGLAGTWLAELFGQLAQHGRDGANNVEVIESW